MKRRRERGINDEGGGVRETGKGTTMVEELQERGEKGTPFAGAVGGRRPSYAANPRQPHSITMLSRIQMTVISFGTPYT